jgi:xylulokinase
MLEATAYSARSIIDAIAEAGVKMERIVAVGGGTKGGLWTQIMSDVTGLPQELAKESMGACYGDALFAARAAGLVADDTVWAQAATTVEPNLKNREVYDRLYGIYKDLYPATKSFVHDLAALQAEEGLVPVEA